MGGVVRPETSSLDRLKALDGLPTLRAQLDEATSLCNHSARAEMILRWLLGNMKLSEEAREEGDCWKLLSSCLRIVSAGRIAFLLGSNGFLETLQKTIAGEDPASSPMRAIAETLELLLSISEGESGNSIKSLLSVNSTIAAPICGNWFRQVYDKMLSANGNWNPSDALLLRPAITLWSLRKRGDSDDELFNTHCLVSVLLLLEMAEDDHSKRKRDRDHAFDIRKIKSILESLLAKHTVLPARSVFFKDREGQIRQSRRQQPGAAQPGIKERLSTLKMTVLREKDQRLLYSVPLLLDIALRSVATPTPKHRFHEGSWIEALFTALRGCLSSESRASKNDVLTRLLDVLHQRGHVLPRSTLSAMFENDALSQEESLAVDWELITGIVRLDANVFCDTNALKLLFDALNESDIAKGEDLVDADARRALKDDVAVPVMNAHARGRTLGMLVDCWIEQLSRPESLSTRSIWSELSTPFSEVCQDAFTLDQFVSLFDRVASDIDQIADSPELLEDSNTTSNLRASLTVIDGLLAGIRDDSTLGRLPERLSKLYDGLQTLVADEAFRTLSSLHYQIWALLTRVFNLWFPTWAAQQSSRTEVAKRGLNSSLRGVLDVALARCTTGADSPDETRVVGAAQLFVATVCNCFGAYKDFGECQRLYDRGIECLGQKLQSALPILIKFPRMLADLPVDTTKKLVRYLYSTAEHAIISGEFDGDNPDTASITAHVETVTDSLRALTSAASRYSAGGQVVGNVVSSTLEELKKKCTTYEAADTELALLSLLSPADISSLRQEERVDILDALLDLSPPYLDEFGTVRLQKRLTLMLGLLRQPCRNARLLTDPTGIWKLIALFEEEDDGALADTAGLQSPILLEILDEILQTVLGSLMATQNQKSTREVLAKLADHTKARLEQETNIAVVGAPLKASFVLYKTVFGVLVQDDSKALKVLHDSRVIGLYFKALNAALDAIASNPKDDSDTWIKSGESQPLSTALLAVLHAPDVFPSNQAYQDLVKSAKNMAFTVLEADLKVSNHQWSNAQVVSFQTACKYAPVSGRRLFPLAEKILEQRLTPRGHVTVLATFEKAYSAGGEEWFDAFQLSMKDEKAQSVATVTLQQRAIRNYQLPKEVDGKEAVTGSTESLLAYKIFDHTLHQVSDNASLQAKRIALQTLIVILKEKPFMVNQYGIEQTLATLQQLLQTYKHASALYMDICNVFASLFAAHRSRLHGRSHLVVPIFQALITTLFATSVSSPEIQVRHARTLARLLETFCKPQVRQRNTNLVDEARKAQARAGQYAQYILHHYCSQILSGSLALRDGVREALLPGLWVMIEAIECHNSDGVKALSAAMNNSERAVLRSVYDDWKRFGKWEGL